jgi:hypothetical protein
MLVVLSPLAYNFLVIADLSVYGFVAFQGRVFVFYTGLVSNEAR